MSNGEWTELTLPPEYEVTEHARYVSDLLEACTRGERLVINVNPRRASWDRIRPKLSDRAFRLIYGYPRQDPSLFAADYPGVRIGLRPADVEAGVKAWLNKGESRKGQDLPPSEWWEKVLSSRGSSYHVEDYLYAMTVTPGKADYESDSTTIRLRSQLRKLGPS